jgi:hypothetical protein
LGTQFAAPASTQVFRGASAAIRINDALGCIVWREHAERVVWSERSAPCGSGRFYTFGTYKVPSGFST